MRQARMLVRIFWALLLSTMHWHRAADGLLNVVARSFARLYPSLQVATASRHDQAARSVLCGRADSRILVT